MANIDVDRIKCLGNDFDAKRCVDVDYALNHVRLIDMVNEYGILATSLATGLSESTVKVHYNNRHGTAMISSSKLDRADYIFSRM